MLSLTMTLTLPVITPQMLIVAEAATIKLSDTKLNLIPGEDYQLSVKNAGKQKVKWKSSDKKVVTVTSKGKVHAVGDAGVKKSHDQQADPFGGVQGRDRDAACESHIGDQDQYGRDELEKCPVQAFGPFDEFIQEDYSCIQAGRSQPEGNAQQVSAAGRHVPDAGDQEYYGRGRRVT